MMTIRSCKPLVVLLLLLLLLSSWNILATEDSEEEDSGDANDLRYLYYNDGPVQDYMGSSARPPFLYDNSSTPRICEFYAPWCPHCQHFRKHFIQFANQILAMAQDQHIDGLQVHAVSCTEHKQICKDFGINGYPQVRLLPANSGGKNSSITVPYWDLHPFRVLNELGVELDPSKTDVADFEKDSKTNTKQKMRGQHNNEKETTVYKPTKQDIYNDAYLSFDFALRNGIFMSHGSLVNTTQSHVFADWLKLMRKSMPPTWRIQGLIRALMENYDEIMQDEAHLLEIVNQHPPPQKHWSKACSKNIKGMGYTCGLWQLFHILTVGATEWNLMILDERSDLYIGMDHAAQTLRNFIQHFFACEVCRLNFVSAFDDCAFDRCHRLHDRTFERHDWIQFPIWLFETHNAVNVRLLHERLEREGRAPASAQDEIQVQWPLRTDCPKCWREEDGAWNEESVYQYLRLEYWPEDSISAMYRQELNEGIDNNNNDNDDDAIELPLPPVAIQVLPLFVIVGLAVGWYTRRKEKQKTGRHKRIA